MKHLRAIFRAISVIHGESASLAIEEALTPIFNGETLPAGKAVLVLRLLEALVLDAKDEEVAEAKKAMKKR